MWGVQRQAGSRRTWGGIVMLTAVALATGWLCAPIQAAITADQRAKLAAAGKELTAAEGSVAGKKFKEAAAAVSKAHAALRDVAGSPDREVQRAVEPLKMRLTQLADALSLEGVALPDLDLPAPKASPDDAKPGAKTPAKPGAKPAAKTPAAKTPAAKTPAKPADGKVSFTSQVAPLLVNKCGRCHIDKAEGKFSITTFAALQKGAEGGPVILPRNSKGSRIIEVIESGDMPRGGTKVTKEELAMLAKWIDEGGVNDAPNATTALRQLAGAAAAQAKAAMPKLDVVPAAAGDKTSFSRDVAAVVAQSCLVCHGNMQPRANLNMATFASFLRGGNSGSMIVPGKPAESLLVKKLKGQSGDRMPLRQPPLPDDVIAKIEAWIAEGARFDGSAPDVDTERVAAVYKAQHATHEELTARRKELATKNWRLAVPGDEQKPQVLETEHFLLLGSVSEAKLKEVAEVAAKQAGRVAATFKAPADKPLVKGRVTIYVFGRQYDYSEYGQMVEKRQLPAVWRGHWGYNVTDAYVCLTLPQNDDFSLDTMVAQQLAGVYVASQGGVPKWFAEGAARATASHLDGRDKRVRAWDAAMASFAALPKAEMFPAGGFPPEETDVLAYGFVRDLRITQRPFQKLLESLRDGATFDRAFALAFKGNPAQSVQAWVKRTAARRR